VNRTTFLSVAAVLALGIPARAADPPKPNILLIVGDDMGYADVGVHGCRDIPNPHLDALAKAGTRFTNGYVSGPYCSPTRAGLLTGRYQTRFGHEFNPAGGGEAGLPLTETTLADRLRSAGYVTGLVGKWHLGNAPARHPQRRGFDEFFGFLGGAHSYFPAKGKLDTIFRGASPVDEKEYLTDAFRREALAFVERHRAKPFFLYLAFNAVHTPMHATDAGLQRFGGIQNPTRRTYAAMMAAMDDAVGAVRVKLRELGLEQNTLVFFVSDNGGPTMVGTSVNGSVNAPLRGSKRTTLEGGVRVPFFVAWPGRLPAGRTFDPPAIQLDLFPTALAAAGVEVRPDWNVEGVNLIPYLTGQNTGRPHDALYWRFGRQMAVRHGDYKLVRYDTAADGGKAGVTGPRLYNLAADIGEATDLMAREPERAKQLQALWDAWDARNVAPLWGGGKQKE
jgi:arylsulfatase A-like enzyme